MLDEIRIDGKTAVMRGNYAALAHLVRTVGENPTGPVPTFGPAWFPGRDSNAEPDESPISVTYVSPDLKCSDQTISDRAFLRSSAIADTRLRDTIHACVWLRSCNGNQACCPRRTGMSGGYGVG